MARILAEGAVEIVPDSTGFAGELRSDLNRDLTAATAGLDRDVRVRVTTDADVAEAQIRGALARVQQVVDQIFERTQARAVTLYRFLEQRVVIRLANKIREWVQKTRDRVKLLLEPFWALMRARLDQLRRGWQAFRGVVEGAADGVARRWRSALAVLSSQLARVREAGQRLFAGIATAAEPHLARLRRGLLALRVPFDVVRAYGTGAFRVLGDAGLAAFARVRTASAPVFTAITSGFDRSSTAARRWGTATAGAARTAVAALGRVRDGFRSAEASSSAFSGRLGTLGGVARRAFTGIQRDLTNLNRVTASTGRGFERFGDRLQQVNNRGRRSRGVFDLVGSGLSAVTGLARVAGSGFSLFGRILQGVTGQSGGFLSSLQNMAGALPPLAGAAASAGLAIVGFGAKVALMGVIVGAVTFAVGAVGAAIAGLPALIGAAVVSFAAFALGMDGIKRAYESSLKPALDQLKVQVSQVFEETLTPAFENLSRNLIPQVTDSMKRLAREFGVGAQEIVKMITEAENVRKINDLINNAANEVRGQLVPALQNVIQAFIDIGGNADIMRDIVGIFTDLTNKTADWLSEMERTGQAESALATLRTTLGKVEDLFFRLLTAAVQFFESAAPGFDSLLDSITPTEEVMRTLGEAFGNTAEAAGNLIRAIPPETWQRIADAIQRVSEKLLALSENRAFQTFVQIVAEAVALLIDSFDDLVNSLSGLTGAFAPVFDALGAVAGAFGSATGAAEDAGAGIPPPIEAGMGRAADAAARGGEGVLTGFVLPAQNLPGAASDALSALPGAVGDPADEAARRATEGAARAAEGAAAGFTPIPPDAEAALSGLGPAVQGAMDAATQAAEAGTTAVRDSVQQGFDGAAEAATAAMPRIPAVVSAAMTAAAAAAQAGGSQIADSVRAGADAAANAVAAAMPRIPAAVTAAMSAAAAAAEAGGQRIADGLRSSTEQAAAAVLAGMTRIAAAVQQGMQQATQAAVQGGQQILVAMQQSFQQVVAITEQSWQRIVAAFQSGGQRAVAIARQTGQQIVATFQALSGPMYSAGFQIISRLAQGMIAAQGQAFAAAASTAAGIRARFPASPAKTGPLSGAGDPLRSGGVIVQRLAAGMAANAAAVTAALEPILRSLVARVNATAANPMVDAAREILARIQSGGPMFEDLTWRGASANVGRYNDALLDEMDRGGSRDTRAFLEDFIRRNTPAAPAPAGAGDGVLGELQRQTAVLVAMRGDLVSGGYGPDMLARLDALIAAVTGRSGTAASRAAGARDLSELGAFP